MSDKSVVASTNLYLEELELMTLLASLRLGTDAYEVTVREVLAAQATLECTLDTIY